MYIVTTLSYEELSRLIRDGKVSLDNSSLFFGYEVDAVDEYFRSRIGNNGYVVGLRGRLNKLTVDLFAQLNQAIQDSEFVILEAQVDEADLIRYRVSGVSDAAAALSYGFRIEEVYEQLDSAQTTDEQSGLEVLCIPHIRNDGKIRITSLYEDITFNFAGISFVKLNKEG